MDEEDIIKKYKSYLLHISKELTKDDIESIKFWCEGTIPKGKLENINSGIALIRALEEYGIINESQNIEEIKNLIFQKILQSDESKDTTQNLFNEHPHSRCFSTWNIGVTYHPCGEVERNIDERIKSVATALERNKENDKLVDIFSGSTLTSLTLSDWIEKKCPCYVKLFLKNLSDFFLFNVGSNSRINAFVKYLQKNKPSFLIKNYNLYDHYVFLMLEDQISNSYFETEKACHVIDYIGFDGKNRTMFFIKFSEGSNIDNLRRDVVASSTFIRMFLVLHKSVLTLYGINLLSIIVIPDESQSLKNELCKECNFCESFIVTQEQFTSFNTNKLFELRKEMRQMFKAIKSENFNIEEFTTSMGFILAFMAIRDGNLVPSLFADYSEQLDQFIILLYPQQLTYSTSKDKRVVLQGGHGSGKTIVGKLQVKQLAEDSQEDIVYFINCGMSEELTQNMKDYVASIGNLNNVICCSISYFQNQNSLSDILGEILERHKHVRKIHFVFDELSLDDITEEDISSFLKVLTSSKYLDSTVYMICQAMSKKRVIRNESSNLYTSFNKQIDYLKEANFVIKILEKSVRYTLAIKRLTEKIAAKLSKHRNSFNSSLFQKEYESTPSNVRIMVTPDKTVERQEFCDNSNENTNNEVGSNGNSHESLVYTDSRVNSDLEQLRLSGMDASLKRLSILKMSNEEKSSNGVIIESNFQYCVSKELGHEIDGSIPLYYNIEALTEVELVQSLAACLKHSISSNEALFEYYENITIIHFEDSMPSLLSSAIKLLEEIEGLTLQFCMKYILDIHGLEYKNVIIYIDSQEYHMRHYLIEAITRCKCNLAVVIKNEESSKQNFISRMFDECSEKKLIVKVDEDSISEFLDEVKEYDMNKIFTEIESTVQTNKDELSFQLWLQQKVLKSEITNFIKHLHKDNFELIKSIYKYQLPTVNMEEIETAKELVQILEKNGIIKDLADINKLKDYVKNSSGIRRSSRFRFKDGDERKSYIQQLVPGKDKNGVRKSSAEEKKELKNSHPQPFKAKKPKVSAPAQFEHTIHVKLDPDNGELTGMPASWAKILSVPSVPVSEQREGLIDVLKFYDSNSNEKENEIFAKPDINTENATCPTSNSTESL